MSLNLGCSLPYGYRREIIVPSKYRDTATKKYSAGTDSPCQPAT